MTFLFNYNCVTVGATRSSRRICATVSIQFSVKCPLVQIPIPPPALHRLLDRDALKARGVFDALAIRALERLRLVGVEALVVAHEDRADDCKWTNPVFEQRTAREGYIASHLPHARIELNANAAMPTSIDWWYPGLHSAFQTKEPMLCV